MNQPNPAISYRQEPDQDFVDFLAKIAWAENSELAGITLIQPCPICGHADGINVFLPVNTALWKTAAPPAGQFVECQCAENHQDRPPNTTGCGRWGMITPYLSKV
jgi:hypothetical protein